MADAPDLTRFVAAQDEGGTYARALAELRAGRKTSHWMWFVFPQIAGLGSSPTAQRYALAGREEARAYLAHPVLGARLRECTDVVAGLDATDAGRVFGDVDALKLRSSMTLFHRADPGDDRFAAVLRRYFDGEADAATDRLLERG